jgi:general secretion pathway protein A
MYKEFYHLHDNPFRLSPDPRYFLFSSRAKGIHDQLSYGLQQGVGFMMVTGEVGVGKTSFLRYFLRNLDDQVERALIYNPALGGAEELLKFILLDWGVRKKFAPHTGKVELLRVLLHYLLNRYHKKKKFLLIIDEAQGLSDLLLEEVRLLSNFEADDEKLIQILLVGQPELRKRIDQSAWRQLHQRIAIKSELSPFQKEEVGAYVRYRLMVAGANEDLFHADAVKALHKASRGIPRIINLIAERSLIAGFIGAKRTIGKAEVKMAARDLDL